MMIRGLLLLVCCSLLSGCAVLAPFASLLSPSSSVGTPLQVHEQTTVELAQDNFMLVRTNVSGVSKGFSLLGFITIYPATLTKAMNRMYSSAEMQPGAPQTAAHLIVEHSSSYWILFGIPRVEVHADIVEFNPLLGAEEKGKPKGAPPEPMEESQLH